MKRGPKDRYRFSHQGKLTWLILGAVAPAVIIVVSILWFGDFSAKVQWTLAIVILTFAAGFISAARDHVVHPLQTMSNLLAALREGDYSIRARGARADDALGEVLLEVNTLGETLRVQRLGAFEATALLRTIMAEIDVAVFTFDPDRRLRLVNRAGENLLGQPMDKLLGRNADNLGLAACYDVDEEERRAWQRLVRVLGHEMNNSLAPIKSLAGSLETLLRREPMPRDWRDDAESGLKSIASRADSLSRFMQAYTRLAKLPPPQK